MTTLLRSALDVFSDYLADEMHEGREDLVAFKSKLTWAALLFAACLMMVVGALVFALATLFFYLARAPQFIAPAVWTALASATVAGGAGWFGGRLLSNSISARRAALGLAGMILFNGKGRKQR